MTYRAIVDGSNRVARWYECFGTNGLVAKYQEHEIEKTKLNVALMQMRMNQSILEAFAN